MNTDSELVELSSRLGAALRLRGWSCATAESCTGGTIGHLITSLPGSSDYFHGGIIAYANEVKIKNLGVKPETLRQHGAVSEETAAQMARGARAEFGVDVGISSTGIAGPGGATPTKPVGLIYIAVETPLGSQVRELRLQGNRLSNIEQTAGEALQLAVSLVSEQLPGR